MQSIHSSKLGIIPVIIAGGIGERFWPLSRKDHPKQMLKLTSERPMILETCVRLRKFDHIIIVANKTLCDQFKQILPENTIYIVEPVARNTAPAIALAAKYIEYHFGDQVMFVETVDHYYNNSEDYLKTIEQACAFAEDLQKLILVGIHPSEPHTGYGYIKNGEKIAPHLYNVKYFREKPNKETAEDYLEEGGYTWNSGILIAQVSVFLHEVEKYIPDLIPIVEKVLDETIEENSRKQSFQSAPKVSIDYAVLEHTSNACVLNSSIHWDDIGDFNALARIMPLDENQSFSRNLYLSLNSKKNIILSNKLVALIGIKDVVIVEDKDVILIAKRSETQRIRDLVKIADPSLH